MNRSYWGAATVLLHLLISICAAHAGENASPSSQPSLTAFEALQKSWHESGRFGEHLGCIIRAATNCEKVGLRDFTSGRILSTNAEPIHISGARREYEGFQIILSPLPQAAEHMAASVSELVADAGIGRIAAANVAINSVGYVRITPGKSPEQLAPDPLMPGPIPDLTPGENQPLWFTVHVPADAKAGDYRGTITIAANDPRNHSSVTIPFVVTVRGFEIPAKISLRSSFWLFRDQLNRFYHLDEIPLDDYLKWVDFALQHRVNPIDVYEGRCRQLVDISLPEPPEQKLEIGMPNPHPDFRKWDRYVDRMIAGGANTIHLGTTHHFGALFCDSANKAGAPAQVARVEEAIRILEAHAKERGWLNMHYLQLRDEISSPESLGTYARVHEDFPKLKLLLTAMSPEAKPLLSIPCPQTPGFDPHWRDEGKRAGGEYWWYVCLSPNDPYANFFIQQTPAQHRALFWQTWSRGVDGLLYWGLNFWSDYKMNWPDNAKGPTRRIQDAATPPWGAVHEFPGDGFSMYPGPTPAEPMSSIRLEAIRDGEEDYEYFLLLDKLIAAAERAGQTSGPLIEARAARDAARQLVSSMTDYPRDGTAYLQVRDRVARAIESLK
jgi:hypothetical protein